MLILDVLILEEGIITAVLENITIITVIQLINTLMVYVLMILMIEPGTPLAPAVNFQGIRNRI